MKSYSVLSIEFGNSFEMGISSNCTNMEVIYIAFMRILSSGKGITCNAMKDCNNKVVKLVETIKITLL